MKIALVTGATSGIGKAAAFKLAENGYNIIITGRRNNRLEEVKKEIEARNNVEVKNLCFDVRIINEVDKAIAGLNDNWKNIDVLINNAGLAAGLDFLDEGSIEDWEQMIDTNVKGMLYISKAVVPFMIKRKKGHIINISSIAGKEVYEKGNVYCATKHAVEALTKGMRIDFLRHNIRVTSISPGAAETGFSLVRFKGDQEKSDKVYEGYSPMYAEDIAEAIWFAVSRPEHININDLIITATAQANAFYTHRKTKN